MDQKSKILFLICSIIAIFGISALGVAYGGLDEIIFDQIPYNYSSYVSLPSNTPEITNQFSPPSADSYKPASVAA